MKKILVLRLSAMGDVSLTVPAIRAVIEANPDLEMTFVTRKFFAPFFYGIPRVHLFFPDFNNKNKGLFGLIRLYKELKKEGPFLSVVDLHDVIRTKIITKLFHFSGIPSFSIDKGREEKKFLLKSKYIRTLKHSSIRYLETFQRAGFIGQIGKAPYLHTSEESTENAGLFLAKGESNENTVKIGLAPFATHKPKIWGINRFKELITFINKEHKAEFYLFGGGDQEIKQLKELQQFSSNIRLVAGNMNLSGEIALIKMLDLMITMDSSNMHLSALSGIPTVSIWGGTHPAFGFFALGQPSEYSIQTPASSLKCRPCSVYGNKPCIYPEPKCMEMVKSEEVYKTLNKFNLIKTNGKKSRKESV